jgi:DNA (cytosine-5)-methyltransferase 1|tara:strand:+ start:243 stop:1418 length:1176 start_codon:yes stop_codon:yes gene_type:complete
MITIGTDFSGIGAPEQALIGLGIKHKSVFACDINKYAKQSFLANHTTETWFDDITQRDHKNTPYCDLYVAGFPCQAFSVAGKRKGFEDTRGTLFFDLFQYIDLKRPKYFVLENVKGLMGHDKGNTFRVIMDSLENLNYTIYHKVLNTKHYGIPQNRERLFIVGFRESHEFEWPESVELNLKIEDLLQDNVNSKYNVKKASYDFLQRHQRFNKFKILGEEKEIASCITAGCNKIQNSNNFIKVEEKYYLTPQRIKKLEEYNERNKKKGNGFRAKFHNVVKDIMSCLKVGGSGSSDLIEWIADVRTDQGIRIRKNRMSPCLTTSSTPIIKQRKIRRLTPLECLRLQGFPDSFHQNCVDAGVSDSQIYKQAGNSMTVNVMMALLSEILKNEKSV